MSVCVFVQGRGKKIRIALKILFRVTSLKTISPHVNIHRITLTITVVLLELDLYRIISLLV